MVTSAMAGVGERGRAREAVAVSCAAPDLRRAPVSSVTPIT